MGTLTDRQDQRHRGVSTDEDGFTIRERNDGTSAAFGPAGDQLTEWENIQEPTPPKRIVPEWLRRRDEGKLQAKDMTGRAA